MAESVAGTNYTYQEYEWLYDNAYKHTIKQLSEITGRDTRSLRGHIDRFCFRNVVPIPADVKATIQENSDLGDALIFLLPDVPLAVIREVLNAS